MREFSINTGEAKYHARAWRTQTLKREAIKEVTKMLQAFIPYKFTVRVEQKETEVPGFPHAPNYKFVATVCDPDPNGSNSHFCVCAYTWDGAVAKLLAAIIDHEHSTPFFPMT